MEDFLQQIEKALSYNLYYIALQSTLTLPDICGALQSIDGTATKTKYIDWYNTYFLRKTFLSADDCYYFRCSNVHQGKTTHQNSTYSRILFVEPSEKKSIVLNNNIINGALNIDVNIFCTDMIASVRNWLTLVKNDQTFQKNYSSFIKRYPNGLPPYIVGVPIIS